MDDLDALLEDLDAAGIGGGGAAKGVGGTAAPPVSRTSSVPAPGRTSTVADGPARSVGVTAARDGVTGAKPTGNLDELDDLLGELDAVMGSGVSPLTERPMPASSSVTTTSQKSNASSSSNAFYQSNAFDPSRVRTGDPSDPHAPLDRIDHGGGVRLAPNPRGGGTGGGGSSRCAPCAFVGGADAKLGRASFMSPDASCDALRCVSCDFDVVSFDGAAWCGGEGGAKGPGVDYMFFRNNYPDAGKMGARATERKGWRAYCCQCSWRSLGLGRREKVDAVGGELRWVCGGH